MRPPARLEVGAQRHWHAGWGAGPWQTSGAPTWVTAARTKIRMRKPYPEYLTLQPYDLVTAGETGFPALRSARARVT